MRALNIKVDNTKKYIKPVYNLYKNYLNNILNSNINNIVTKIIYTKFRLLKQGISITLYYMLQNNNILQLLQDFG